MGIKNLRKFLQTKFPDVFVTKHLSEFQYQKVAIDVTLYLCQYKAMLQDRWLYAFIRLIACLRENGIHCVFVYDTASPLEKTIEKEERKDAKVRMENQLTSLKKAVEKFEKTGEVDQQILDYQKKKNITVGLLTKNPVNVKAIKSNLEKSEKQLFKITKEDFELTKKLFRVLDVPYYESKSEAETFCSNLCLRGKVDAVLTEDTDVLAYGTPIFLSKIQSKEGTCCVIEYKKLLECMEFTPEQFLDFCIMCGTDYNKNIFKVGPQKAYSLIKEFKNIETIAKETGLDVSVLNHVRTREIFTTHEDVSFNVPYCGIPDYDDLEIVLRMALYKQPEQIAKQSMYKDNEERNNVDYAIENYITSIKKSFSPPEIVVVDE